MRTEELIKALSLAGDGIEIYSRPNQAFCKTLYIPRCSANGETLFEVLFEVAQRLIADRNCPLLVKKALEAYDLRSARLQQ